MHIDIVHATPMYSMHFVTGKYNIFSLDNIVICIFF